MNMYKIKGRFDHKTLNGEIIGLKGFIKNVERGFLSDYDGFISEVLVDGQVTDIKVEDMDKDSKENENSLYSLLKIKGTVQIVWCNR